MTYPPQLGFNTSFQCNLVTPHTCFCALRGRISLATYVIFCSVICPKVSLQSRDSHSQLAKKRQVEISCLFSMRNGGWQEKQLIARCARPTKVRLTRQPDNSAARLVSARRRLESLRTGRSFYSVGPHRSGSQRPYCHLVLFAGHTLLSQFDCQIQKCVLGGFYCERKRFSQRMEKIESITGTAAGPSS